MNLISHSFAQALSLTWLVRLRFSMPFFPSYYGSGRSCRFVSQRSLHCLLLQGPISSISSICITPTPQPLGTFVYFSLNDSSARVHRLPTVSLCPASSAYSQSSEFSRFLPFPQILLSFVLSFFLSLSPRFCPGPSSLCFSS